MRSKFYKIAKKVKFILRYSHLPMLFGYTFTGSPVKMSAPVHSPAFAAPCPAMNLARLFAEHPATVGETYAQHLRVAAGFGLAMIGGGLACLVHALLPFAFVTRGSETVARLYERMVTS